MIPVVDSLAHNHFLRIRELSFFFFLFLYIFYNNRHNYFKHLALKEISLSIVRSSLFSSMLSQTAFNIADHYYNHREEEMKKCFINCVTPYNLACN